MKKSSVYNPFRFPYKLSPFQALLTASAQGCYLRMPKSSYLVIRIEVIINLIMIMKSFNRLEALAHCDSYSSFNDETAPPFCPCCPDSSFDDELLPEAFLKPDFSSFFKSNKLK